MKNKGFTLAELLIVVAIIAVLVAVAVPVFSNQLEASREAVDIHNLRAAYSCATLEVMTGTYTQSLGRGTDQDRNTRVYVGWYDPVQNQLLPSNISPRPATLRCGKAKKAGLQGPEDLPEYLVYNGSATNSEGTSSRICVVIATSRKGDGKSVVTVGFVAGSAAQSRISIHQKALEIIRR